MKQTIFKEKNKEEKILLKTVITSENGEKIINNCNLLPNHFIKNIHREAYNVIQDLIDEGYTGCFIREHWYLIENRLNQKIELDVNDIRYIKGLAEDDSICVAKNINPYVDAIYFNWKKENIKNVLEASIRRIEDIESIKEGKEVIDATENSILNAYNNEGSYTDSVSIQDFILKSEDFILNKNAEDSIIPTPFKAINNACSGGFRRGELVLIGGRPSMGKTTFGLNLIMHADKKGIGSLMFSIEMSGKSVADKLISIYTRTPIKSFNKETFEKVKNLSRNSKIFIDEDTSAMNDICRKICRLKRKNPDLGMIVIDYLGFIKMDGKLEARHTEIGDVTRRLKLIAKKCDVVMVLLAQFSRVTEKNKDKIPSLSDFRGSGCIEQDADIALLLHRDSLYKQVSAEIDEANIILAKNRNGTVGRFIVNFYPSISTFTEK